jgi:hypothetical protein
MRKDKGGSKPVNTKEIQNQKKFYKKYINSPTYKDRLLKSGYVNPDKVVSDRSSAIDEVTVHNNRYREPSRYYADKHEIDINTNQAKEIGTAPNSILAHELSHSAQSSTKGFKANKNLSLNEWEESQINKRNKQYQLENNSLGNSIKSYIKDKTGLNITKSFSHDAKANEDKADLDAYRYNLYKDGIYDISKGSKFDKNLLQKGDVNLKNDKGYKRLRENHSDEDLIWMMNNLANNNNKSDITMAKKGIKKIKVKKYNTGVQKINPNYDKMLADNSQIANQQAVAGQVAGKGLDMIAPGAGTIANGVNSLMNSATKDEHGIYKSKTAGFINERLNPLAGINALATGDGSAIANYFSFGLAGKSMNDQLKDKKAKADQLAINDNFNQEIGTERTTHQKTQVMKDGVKKVGTKVIEIEGKKTPEIHTDANFNVKNLGTTPHSKGGNKVLAQEGDIVFPTQDSPAAYAKIMNAIESGDVSTLKQEQNKLPEDKPMKKKNSGGNGGTKTPPPDGYKEPKKVNALPKIGGLYNDEVNKKTAYGDYAGALAGLESGISTLLRAGDPQNPYKYATIATPSKDGTGKATYYKYGGESTETPMVSKDLLKAPGLPTPPSKVTGVDLPANVKDDVPKDMNGLGNLTKYAGIVNNFAQSLRKPEVETNQHLRPDLLKYEDRSEPLRKQSRMKQSMDMSTGRNVSGGNVANYRSNAQGASIDNYGRQESINNHEMQRADAIDVQNVGIKNQFNQYNHQLDAMTKEANAKNRAVPGAYRDAAINDMVKVSQMDEQMRNQKQYSKDYLSLLKEMGYNYEFNDALKAEWAGDKGMSVPPSVDNTTVATREKRGSTTTTVTQKPSKAGHVRRIGNNIRNIFKQ